MPTISSIRHVHEMEVNSCVQVGTSFDWFLLVFPTEFEAWTLKQWWILRLALVEAGTSTARKNKLRNLVTSAMNKLCERWFNSITSSFVSCNLVPWKTLESLQSSEDLILPQIYEPAFVIYSWVLVLLYTHLKLLMCTFLGTTPILRHTKLWSNHKALSSSNLSLTKLSFWTFSLSSPNQETPVPDLSSNRSAICYFFRL